MTAPKTEFASLPRELRDIIWEFTLPPPRLVTLDGLRRVRFDDLSASARRAYELCFRDQQASEPQRVEPSDTTHCFDLRERHPPPVTTQICRESRQFAHDAGYFLLPAWGGTDEDALGRGPGAAWFGEAADTLYIEGSRVPFFLTTAPFRIPNAARVRNVGVNWKYVQGGLTVWPGEWGTPRSRTVCQRRLLSLYAYAPGMATLLLVRTGVQYRYDLERLKGEECAGGPGVLEARLVPLPSSARTWVPRGERISWGDVLGALRDALGENSARERWEEVYKGGAAFPPEIVGCGVEWVKAGR